jgi:hypothetical protein
VTYVPRLMPPEAYGNPYAAAAVTMEMIGEGAQGLIAMFRRRREVRRLDRIATLPPDWDAAERHCQHR